VYRLALRTPLSSKKGATEKVLLYEKVQRDLLEPASVAGMHPSYLTQSVYKVVWPKSIPTQIRHLGKNKVKEI